MLAKPRDAAAATRKAWSCPRSRVAFAVDGHGTTSSSSGDARPLTAPARRVPMGRARLSCPRSLCATSASRTNDRYEVAATMDRPSGQCQICGAHADSTHVGHHVVPGRPHCRHRTPTSRSTNPAVASRHRAKGTGEFVVTRPRWPCLTAESSRGRAPCGWRRRWFSLGKQDRGLGTTVATRPRRAR